MRVFCAQFAPIAIAVLAVLGTGCGKGSNNGGGSGGSDYGEASLGPGVVVDIESDGTRAYLGTRGLFTPIGLLRAIDGSGEMEWELYAPDTISDVMIGTNGLVYASTPFGSVAATKSGEWTPFDGARGGILGWHPWGQPMAAPPSGGLAVMDDRGDVLVEALTEWVVRGIASYSDGSVYAFVEPTSDEVDTVPYLIKMNDRLETDWAIPIELDAMSTGRVELAVARDMVVASWGNNTAAWSHDGEVLWAYENVPGALLIDEDQTTYISGTRPTAVGADGEIQWEQTNASLMTITGSGLVGMVVVDDTIYQAPISTETGERDGGFLWTPMTDVFAPVAVGGSTIAVAHQITGSSYFPESGGIVVEQGSETFVDSAGFGGGTDAIWPSADGIGGRRALAVTEVQPEEADLFGLWVAQEGPRARAVELQTGAYDFGIEGENAYGIYDYDVRQPPRLIEVGTWSYDGTNLSFSPQTTVDGVSVAGSIEVYNGLPGTLKVDDPAQDIVRTFRRARRLPGADSLFAGADTLGWLYGEGALDGDTGVAIVPNGDGATVVSAFNFIGRLGGETYVVDRAAGGGEDDESDNLIFGVTSDGDITGVRHNKTPGPTTMDVLAKVGDDTRVYGPFTVGAGTEQIYSASLQVGGGTVGISDEQPWEGPSTSTAEIGPAAPWKGGALYAGVDYADSPEGDGFVLRIGDDGRVLWNHDMGDRVSAAAGLTGGDVVVVGEFTGVVDVGSTTLVGNTSTFFARLDGESGEPIDGYRIAGRFIGVEASLTALPDGGVLLSGRPSSRYNAGTGGVFASQDFIPLVFSAFGPELEPRWTRSFTPDPEIGFGVDSNAVEVDPYGMITVGGALSGDYSYEGVSAGREDRTTAMWQFGPCGSLLWQRRFNTRVATSDVAFGDDGTIYATGSFAGDDLFVPPWVALFSGGNPDVQTGFAGGGDTLVFTVQGSQDRFGEISDCRSAPPSTSVVKIDPRGFGSGRVTSEPAGIDCPGQCEAEFSDLTELTLIAEADDGSSFDAFQGAGCNSRDCRFLVAGDVVVDAWFDASSVDWALPVPGVSPSDLHVASSDEHAVVGFLFRGQPVQIGEQTYPANAGVGIARVTATGNVEVQDVVGSRSTNLLTGLDVDTDGAVALSGSSTLLPAATENGAIVVLNEDGSERWSRAIQTNNQNASIEVAFGDGVVAAYLPANGEITIDTQTVTAPLAAIALFDSATGDLRQLVGMNGQVSGLRAESGSFVAEGDVSTGVEIVPGFQPSGGGRWFVRFDDQTLAVTDTVAWRFQFDMPLAFQSSEGDGMTLYGRDDNLRPAWAGRPGLTTGWQHPYVPGGDESWLGNLAADAATVLARPGRNARYSVVRLDPSGRAIGGWATPDEDQLAVAGLATSAGRAIAIVESVVVRGPDGDPLEMFDAPTSIIVSVRVGGAQ